MNARQAHGAERTTTNAPVSMADIEAALAAPHKALARHPAPRRTGDTDISGCMFGLTNRQLLRVAACRPKPTQLEAHLSDRLAEAVREMDLMARERLDLLGAH